MSDVNVNTPAQKSHSELVMEMYVIISLAEIGEAVSISENNIDLDTLNALFQVIRERLDSLITVLRAET
ncbi:hypothetical protein [Candidatus Albibeggiatoa sp. nov. BB20]|uniref:hypothetical protein n=1 Tax=Candidatus Albibeggiatoa sp. nov. BB20 TaxID=3162723 RepID=UPI00336599E5